MQKIIIICGPTASGKTPLAARLACRFGGEIVSADSQQVWRGFDIGSAKPDLMEQSSVPHYLIDVADPEEHFDAARFVELADKAIGGITARGKLPFVVGGTGMYLRMLVSGICSAPPRDESARAGLEMEADKRGVSYLHCELQKVDPDSAAVLHPNDRTRVIRALEVYRVAGIPASSFRKNHDFQERRYEALKIGLLVEREELYRRIDERVDHMIALGLVDEVRRLLSFHRDACQPFSAVGYREVVSYLKGETSLDEAIRLIKRNSRHLAKRQMTWFRSDQEVWWFSPVQIDKMISCIDSFL